MELLSSKILIVFFFVWCFGHVAHNVIWAIKKDKIKEVHYDHFLVEVFDEDNLLVQSMPVEKSLVYVLFPSPASGRMIKIRPIKNEVHEQ